jgi:hypothetical protein
MILRRSQLARLFRRRVSLVTALILVAVAAVILGFASQYYRAREFEREVLRHVQSAPFVQHFMDDLRANRVDEAYESTSEAFRSRVDRPSFRRFVAAHSQLSRGMELREGISARVGRHLVSTYRGAPSRAPASQIEWTLRLVSEADELRVDQLTVDGEDAARVRR